MVFRRGSAANSVPLIPLLTARSYNFRLKLDNLRLPARTPRRCFEELGGFECVLRAPATTKHTTAFGVRKHGLRVFYHLRSPIVACQGGNGRTRRQHRP